MEGVKVGRPEQQEIQDSQLQSENEKPPGVPTFSGQVQGHRGGPSGLLPPINQLFSLPNDIRHRVETWQEKILLHAQININRHLQGITQQQGKFGYETELPEEVRYQNRRETEPKYLYDVNARQHINPTAGRANPSGHQTQHEQAFQQQMLHAQNGLNFPQQSGSQLSPLMTSQPGQNQKPLQFTQYQNFDICPMGRLPYDACTWRGEYDYTPDHIRYQHAAQIVYCNFTLLPANRAILMSTYNEIFLCYTLTAHEPDKLYCVVQHAWNSSIRTCLKLYQYRCEICAANRYEKITETRLVAGLDDDFETLVRRGKCVRWDAEVVRNFIGDDDINVSFKISIAEQI
jgi:hypothetical protein